MIETKAQLITALDTAHGMEAMTDGELLDLTYEIIWADYLPDADKMETLRCLFEFSSLETIRLEDAIRHLTGRGE